MRARWFVCFVPLFACAARAQVPPTEQAHTRALITPSAISSSPAPPQALAPASEAPRVVSLSLGTFTSCALLSTGDVRCWGQGRGNQLGTDSDANIGDDEVPASAGNVKLPGRATEIAAAGPCALLDTGKVHCWGMRPLSMDLGRKALHLYAASGRACALFEGGAIRCWGSGQGGQLGYGNRDDIRDSQALAAAGDVDVGGKVLQLALGGEITCALLDSGAVRCWGRGAIGYPAQRATASKPFRAIGADLHPAGAGDVDVGGRVTAISASGDHVCALLEGGRVRRWGSGFRGQLGYGNDHDVGQRDTPASAGDVDIGGKVVQLAAGEAHTCALLDTGAVRCWGQGDEGRLGYGNARSIGDDETPASAGDVAVGGKVVQIAAGGFHTCALLATGAVRCWSLGESPPRIHAWRSKTERAVFAITATLGLALACVSANRVQAELCRNFSHELIAAGLDASCVELGNGHALGDYFERHVT